MLEFKQHATFYGESRDMQAYLDKLAVNLEKIPDFKTDEIPPFCKSLSPDQWYEYGVETFRLTVPGDLTDIVEDPEASSGKLARLYSTRNWLLQLQIPRGSWKIMVSLRINPKVGKPAGKALEIGLYNEALGQTEHVQEVDGEGFSGEGFQWFEFGEVTLLTGYLYIAGLGNPDINYIEVERIILLRK